MLMDVEFRDNSAEILRAAKAAKQKALEEIGRAAEGHAKEEIKKAGAVDTGRLRNSIAHAEKGDSTYIGTNVEYGPYIELGTGIYASDGTGRKDPWFYQDEKGKWHYTRGIKPVHFLKKAATEHAEEYENIAKQAFDS